MKTAVIFQALGCSSSCSHFCALVFILQTKNGPATKRNILFQNMLKLKL